MNSVNYYPKSASRGFTLIEVLVAIIVVALGALAAGSLHLRALRETSDSAHRSAAVQLARDLVERVKTNRYLPNPLDPSNPTDNLANYIAATNLFATAAGSATNPNCYAAGCTGLQRAVHDAGEWAGLVSARLPGGSAVMCRTNTPNLGTAAAPGCTGNAADPLIIKFWWAERGAVVDNRSSTALVAAAPTAPLFYMMVNP
jgi:type IV pilus assembly protein PilV